MADVRLQSEPIDIGAETARFGAGRTDIGAVVTFAGRVRDSEGDAPLTSLTLEHYPGMTEAEIARIAAEAERRWPLQACLVIHRHGRMAPGEPIVLVATASAHRQAAFEAASFLMDWLKTRAPFWKRAETSAGAVWVEARREDDALAERWQRPATRKTR